MARTAIALELAKIDVGHFPRTLAGLSPKYLRRMPRDVYVGDPLRYRRTKNGYILTCNWKTIPLRMNKRQIAMLTVNYPAKLAKVPHETNTPAPFPFPPPISGVK